MMNDSPVEAQLELALMPPDPLPGPFTALETALFQYPDV